MNKAQLENRVKKHRMLLWYIAISIFIFTMLFVWQLSILDNRITNMDKNAEIEKGCIQETYSEMQNIMVEATYKVLDHNLTERKKMLIFEYDTHVTDFGSELRIPFYYSNEEGIIYSESFIYEIKVLDYEIGEI